MEGLSSGLVVWEVSLMEVLLEELSMMDDRMDDYTIWLGLYRF